MKRLVMNSSDSNRIGTQTDYTPKSVSMIADFANHALIL